MPDPAACSVVEEHRGVLAYLDAQLAVASPRDAAPLARQRRDESALYRAALAAERAAGEGEEDEEAQVEAICTAIRDREGLPDWAVEAIEAAVAERRGG